LVEHESSRTHKRLALKIFFVTRLLTNEQDSSRARSLSKDSLSCVLPEITRLTTLCRLANGSHSWMKRDESRGRTGLRGLANHTQERCLGVTFGLRSRVTPNRDLVVIRKRQPSSEPAKAHLPPDLYGLGKP
jgi:hypothetical protein